MIDQSYRNRKCTDVLCTLIFVALLGSVGFFGYINFQSDKEFTLLDMYDQFGNVCGRNSAKDFPYLHIKLDLKAENPFKNRFCIKDCPKISNQQVESLGKDQKIHNIQIEKEPI